MSVLIFAYFYLKALFFDAIFAEKSGHGRFDQSMVEINIVDTNSSIKLPQNYLDRPREYLKNRASEAVLILATMPEFQGRTQENNRAFEGVGGHWPVLVLSGRTMTIEKSYQSFSYAIERDTPQERPIPRYGLDYYSIVYKDPNFEDIGPSELYVQGSLSKIELFVVCSNHLRHQSHSCMMFFPVADIVFKVTFPRNNISAWQAIKDRINNVIAVQRQADHTGD